MKDSLSNMMEMFQKRMAAFEAELTKSPGTSTSSLTSYPSTLATDFASFKTFILEALGNLQKQVQVLALDVDRLDMRSRRKMLLLHGIAECKKDGKEDTAFVVTNIIKERLHLTNFTSEDIRRCHRMGREGSVQKPRPIVLKLDNVKVRDTIWFAKKKLKDSGITVSEFLTKMRHNIFMTAREKLGVEKCWTREGHIFVIDADGSRRRLTAMCDINTIQAQPLPRGPHSDGTNKDTVKTLPPRPKRAPALKK